MGSPYQPYRFRNNVQRKDRHNTLLGSGMHIINVIVISPLILIIIKSLHLILIDYIDYIDYILIS